MNIFTKMDQVTDLTENEKTLVDYLKNNAEEVPKMSANEISNTSYISVSTIYRLCHKLDLSGLSELKVQIAASFDEYKREEGPLDYNYPFQSNETQNQVINNMKTLYEQTITSSRNLIDVEQIKSISKLLLSDKIIDIYTSAGNIFFAENFKFQMAEIGRFINVPVEEYQQRLTAASSTSDHLAIVISFGGRGVNVLDIIRTLKNNKTPIVMITSTNDNPYIKYADYKLFLCSSENHYNKISSFATRLSLLYTLDCLYTCYFNLEYKKNTQFKVTTYKKLSKKYKDE